MHKFLYVLGQLSDAEVDWLARHGTRLRHAKGAELIHCGRETDHVFIVLDGQMSVRSKGGMEINRVGAGEILGEVSLVDSSSASATVVVIEDAYVLALDKSVLRRKLDEDTTFACHFYRAIAMMLAERLRRRNRHLADAGAEPSEAEAEAEDDLDELGADVLDKVHLAGARFERLLQRLMG